jgi:hypothetical protein
VASTASEPDRLLVVVGGDEEARALRQQLANIGLEKIRYYVDTKDELATGGRVTALPTTLLLAPHGRVRDRVQGVNAFRLGMLEMRSHNETADFEGYD